MGNLYSKNSEYRNDKRLVHSTRNGQAFTSQFSLSHFVGNLSGRSFASVVSSQSVYSASRPWSRVSRRRWNDSTLNNPLDASKTAWPVAHKESIFLPEFPITTDLLQKDFEIVKTVAKGAFGEVYKVKKISEDKEYALKVLNKSQIVSENAVRQVKEEARIQAAVGHHSFVAGSVSRWQTKKRLYIAPEILQREPYGHAVDWWSLGVIACYMLTGEFPTPAVNISATKSTATQNPSSSIGNTSINSNNSLHQVGHSESAPGTLPDEAKNLSKGARALLMRLLERDSKVRLRNLRQLQQTAFYMGFNFEHIKVKKVAPKKVIENISLITNTLIHH